MKIGTVGLDEMGKMEKMGKMEEMGATTSEPLLKRGHEVVAFDRQAEAFDAVTVESGQAGTATLTPRA